MNLKLDIVKDIEGSHMLHALFETANNGPMTFAIPLGKDLFYALYKGIGLELKHLDVSLNEAGQAALTAAKEQLAKDANGTQEQAQAPEGSLPAADASAVLPASQ